MISSDASEELDVKGKKIRVSMLHNPSHLEAANPASMGKTRSKQQMAQDGAFNDNNAVQFANTALNIQVRIYWAMSKSIRAE